MKTNRSLRFSTLLVMLLLFSMLLGACQLPASEGPDTTGGEGDMPVPGEATPTEQTMGGLDPNEIMTQTAAAAGPGEPQPTLPPAVTNTPQPQPTQPPEPTSEPVVLEPTPGIPTTYSLQKGEFPFCIARRFNVNQSEMLSINGLTLASKPHVGFTLKIPQTGNSFVGGRSLVSHPTTYTVKAGDTIYTIACKYGDVSPDMIGLANNLSAPYNLTVGMELAIP